MSATVASAPSAEDKNKTILELLEEDDEFEEFENGNWDEIKENNKEDGQLWQVSLSWASDSQSAFEILTLVIYSFIDINFPVMCVIAHIFC